MIARAFDSTGEKTRHVVPSIGSAILRG